MFNKVRFELTDSHLKLIRKMNVSYNDYYEFGAPEIDPKRPYGNGNGNVYKDIAEILDIKPSLIKDYEQIFSDEQEEMMLALHKETAKALQVIISSYSFELGVYESEEYRDNWAKV